MDAAGKPTKEQLFGTGCTLDGRDQALLDWVTDSGIVALISDNYAVEVFFPNETYPEPNLPGRPFQAFPEPNLPADPTKPFAALGLHEHCLYKLGCYLGEIWCVLFRLPRRRRGVPGRSSRGSSYSPSPLPPFSLRSQLPAIFLLVYFIARIDAGTSPNSPTTSARSAALRSFSPPLPSAFLVPSARLLRVSLPFNRGSIDFWMRWTERRKTKRAVGGLCRSRDSSALPSIETCDFVLQ